MIYVYLYNIFRILYYTLGVSITTRSSFKCQSMLHSKAITILQGGTLKKRFHLQGATSKRCTNQAIVL